MKLKDVKDKIDQYFDHISPEEFYKTLIQYNMKKTIFEGTINGEKFDNVVDYNNRMQELLGQGAKIDASSNTRSVDEPTEIPQKTKDMLESGRMYPGFETMSLGTDFIEKALAHHNEKVADSLNQYIQETVIPGINKMNREDLGIYLDNLDKILAHLGTIDRKNEEALKQADDEYQEHQERLVALQKKIDNHEAIGGVLSMFTKTYSELKDRAIEVASKQIRSCQCGGDCCKAGTTDKPNYPTNEMSDPLNGLLKLVREIFKD